MGQDLIPPPIPLSSEHVSDDGIYLLENGEDCLIYVGSTADQNVLQQLLGFSSIDEVPTQVLFFSLHFWFLIYYGTEVYSHLHLLTFSLLLSLYLPNIFACNHTLMNNIMFEILYQCIPFF